MAGTVLACTPAAALIFRFNNPDAFLVLLMVIAAYCLTRAVAGASWRWLVLVGAVMGAAFLTKMLQGFLVLPGFAAAYLLAAPTSWRNRALHLVAATGVLVVAAGWWVAIVQSIPAGSRPYVGGSTDDTVLDLAFGYNGLSRILGNDAGADSQWGGATFRPASSATGLRRLFTGEFGNEISWLLPVALFVVVFGGYLWARGHLGRDERAAYLAWSGWLLVTGVVFTFMNGTVHPYYTVALAPAVAALIGLGSVWAWRSHAGLDGRIALAVMLGLAGWWSVNVLNRNHFGPVWMPMLITAASVVGISAALIGRLAVVGRSRPRRRVGYRRGNGRVLHRDGDDTASRGDSQRGRSQRTAPMSTASRCKTWQRSSRSAAGWATRQPTGTSPTCSAPRRRPGRPQRTDRSPRPRSRLRRARR